MTPHARILSLPYPISEKLRFSASPASTLFHEYSTAKDVYDAIGLLREAVRRDSRYHIDGFGVGRYNEVVDWLEDCGYPVTGLRIERR
jgi:hypothetical protein